MTKEALVEEFITKEDAGRLAVDDAYLTFASEPTVENRQKALDLLTRYATAQRAEGAREEIRAHVLELIGDDPYKHTLTEVRIVERLTPTETETPLKD